MLTLCPERQLTEIRAERRCHPLVPGQVRLHTGVEKSQVTDAGSSAYDPDAVLG